MNEEQLKALLEKPCGDCNQESRTYLATCMTCGGRGSVPTEAGQYLLDFLSHHCDRRESGPYYSRDRWIGGLNNGIRDAIIDWEQPWHLTSPPPAANGFA